MNGTSTRIGRVLFVVGVLSVTAAAPTAAQIGTTHNVPDDFATITEALEVAVFGDTILVGPGVYKESLIFTVQKGDGVVLRSVSGATETTISYGDVPNSNEAVVTLQQCSNSTQIVGFTIDGRSVARRGILANSQSRVVLKDLVISGAEYGIAAHRASVPYVRDCIVESSLTAGLFIQGGSADVKDCVFTTSEKFGVYIRGTSDMVKLQTCEITNNGQVGVQATDGEFSFDNGVVIGNGDTGIILQDVSPEITSTTIAGHPNVGVVLDASWAVLRYCTIKENTFGVVVSIEGEPKILSCTFDNNPSYHIGIEGDARPLIGGSIENANRFLGEPGFAIQSSSTAHVVATHNYWDKPCVPAKLFQISNGRVKRKPWMSGNLLRVFDDCDAARKYNKKWKNDKLDAQGEPIKKKSEGPAGAATATTANPATTPTESAGGETGS